MNMRNIDRLARAIADLMNSGREVVLVTSGAIGVGVGCLDLPERPSEMRDKQAVAAVGQCELMNVYSRCFAEYSRVVAQILLTKDGIDDPITRANISNTMEALIEKGILPVVNENDTVSTAEIPHAGTFGDNDTLSALVARVVNADLLIILSDIDALYDSNPKENPDAKRISVVTEVSDELITPPLKKVIRIATAEDAQRDAENRLKERDAMALCQKKVGEHKLQMKLVGCEYTFDNSKIMFYFTSDKRVDFRALVKDLAAAFHTRIELRQIGVRDEARMMGGLGMCGRPVCCAQFLGDFQPVSIKMAKEQSLSLNPTKISGICGRLMCCLKYEEDHYEATRKRMPRVGKEVQTPDGVGTVVDLNILKETVRVRIPKGDSTEQKDYPMADVQRLQPAARPPRKAKPGEGEAEQALDAEQTPDAPDDDSIAEFAGEEGLTADEALAEIEEISSDAEEDLVDLEADSGAPEEP